GEGAELFITVKNEGAATSNAQVVLSPPGYPLTVSQSLWNIPEIGAGEILSNAASPYLVSVDPFAALDNEVELVFSISAENFYSSTINWPIWISPAFANHDIGSVSLTITNFGQIGYQKYLYNSDPPPESGFYFLPDGPNALYLGSLMAGVPEPKVSDCAFGGSDYYEDRFDWQVASGGDLAILPGAVADEEGLAIYQDTGAPFPPDRIGLEITQHSYAWASPPRNDFVIISYLAKNISGQPLSDLYLGLYMDWDLIFYFDNKAGWDAGRNLGYVYSAYNRDADQQYYGTTLLEGSLMSYRVIDLFADYPSSGPSVKPRMSDSTKYAFMSEGMVKTSSTIASDQATLLAAGPYALANRDCVQVVFAILAGENLLDLRANADSAQVAWNGIANQIASNPTADQGIQVVNIFPRPANGSLNVTFRLAEGGKVAFNLLDILGRVTPLWEGDFPAAGVYRVDLPQQNIASGVYWLLAQNGPAKSAAKVIWLK
ncbi:MAG TPA: hypothetical protein VF398_01210, partial [bacterium]